MECARQQMKSCGFGLAGNEQSMRFSRRPAFEHEDAVAWLGNLLDSSPDQGGGDLKKHTLNFGGAQCHVAADSCRETLAGDCSTRPHCSTSSEARTIRARFPRIELQIA